MNPLFGFPRRDHEKSVCASLAMSTGMLSPDHACIAAIRSATQRRLDACRYVGRFAAALRQRAYDAVAKSGLIDPSSARAQFFPWTLPDGIPPIQNGFRNFGGGLMAACALEIAIDLDRHMGYRITSCNDGAYDANEWAKAKAAADHSFDKEVKGTLSHVAVKSFQISTAEQQTPVCDANAMWKATPPQRNFAPTADSISNLTTRNNNDMRMEGAFTVYTPEGLVLKKEMEQLAGP